MTPADVILAARQKYNAIGDSFYSDAELYTAIHALCLEVISDGLVIEGKYSTSTVVSQQEYDFPTNAINIRRITYNGKKLDQITLDEADQKYTNTAGVYGSGTSRHYVIWDRVIYLYPVPDAVKTLLIFSHDTQQTITSASTISLPDIFHPLLIDGVVAEMAGKDKNFAQYDRLRSKFDAQRIQRVRDYRRAKRGDSPAMVKNIDVDGYSERRW